MHNSSSTCVLSTLKLRAEFAVAGVLVVHAGTLRYAPPCVDQLFKQRCVLCYRFDPRRVSQRDSRHVSGTTNDVIHTPPIQHKCTSAFTTFWQAGSSHSFWSRVPSGNGSRTPTALTAMSENPISNSFVGRIGFQQQHRHPHQHARGNTRAGAGR